MSLAIIPRSYFMLIIIALTSLLLLSTFATGHYGQESHYNRLLPCQPQSFNRCPVICATSAMGYGGNVNTLLLYIEEMHNIIYPESLIYFWASLQILLVF